ncbi:MAG TPA: hypothetical protein VIK72_19610 [Clostridiaceae bacterium]
MNTINSDFRKIEELKKENKILEINMNALCDEDGTIFRMIAENERIIETLINI